MDLRKFGKGGRGGQRGSSGGAALMRSVSLFLAQRSQGRKMRQAALPSKQHADPRKLTHFNKSEADGLCSLFNKLLTTAPQADSSPALCLLPVSNRKKEGIDRGSFRDILHSALGIVTEQLVMDRLFSAFDAESDGLIRLEEWLIGLSVLLKGSLVERIVLAFSVYDLNNDGYIVKEEMIQLLKNSLVKQPQDEDPEEGVKELVDIVLKKIDADGDGKISLDDFKQAVKREPLYLEAFGQCLPTEDAAQTFLATLTVN